MRLLSVVSEPFAVVAGDDHQRLLMKVVVRQPVDDTPELRVGIHDFAVVPLVIAVCRCLA